MRFQIFLVVIFLFGNYISYPQIVDTLNYSPETTTFTDPLFWSEGTLDAAVKFASTNGCRNSL
jgi:hypothetical protein